MAVLDFLTPLFSVLLGAGITYGLNVHARRRTHIEDLFTDAIAAVAAAEASRDYTSSVAPWEGCSEEEYAAFLTHIRREATLDHIHKVAAAREALARVAPYRPEVESYYRGGSSVVWEQASEIIALLRKGASDRDGRRRPSRREHDAQERSQENLPRDQAGPAW